MINEKITRFCKNYTEIENYENAINDNTQTWHCHHKKEIEEGKTPRQLKHEGLYYNRPPQEFIFLTKSEHKKLHNIGKKYFLGKHHTEETKRKQSESQKGKRNFLGKHHTEEWKMKHSEDMKGEKNPNFGKHFSDEYKKKMSEMKKMYYENKKMLNV